MDIQRWGDFREKYPMVANRMLELGSKLYEMGVERARYTVELRDLVSTILDAPPEIREILGLDRKFVNGPTVLEIIFEQGSTLLLDYVRDGKC